MKEIKYYFNETEYVYKMPDKEYFNQLVKCFAEMYGIDESASRTIIVDWLSEKEVEEQFEKELKEYFKDAAYKEFLWRKLHG